MENTQSWEYLDLKEVLDLKAFLEKSLTEFTIEKWLESVIPQNADDALIAQYDVNLSKQEIDKVVYCDQGVSEPLYYMFGLKSKRMRVLLAILTAKELNCSRVRPRQKERCFQIRSLCGDFAQCIIDNG